MGNVNTHQKTVMIAYARHAATQFRAGMNRDEFSKVIIITDVCFCRLAPVF